MKGLVAAAAAAACLLGLPAIAQAAEPPPGSAMSTNLEYLARVPDAAGITEGKFDRVRGTDVMVITGRFGFKTYDVSDPADPQPLDAYLPPELAANGYWQNEDMELDTRRKLIIGALDPRHTELAPTDCTGQRRARSPIRSARAASTSSPTPTRRTCARSATSSRCRPATRRAASRTAATSGPAARRGANNQPRSARPRPDRRLGSGDEPARRRRPADLGHRPAQPDDPKVSDEPVDLWRNDGYTDYSHDVDEDDAGHRLGQRPRRRPRLRHERPAPRPVPEPGPPGDAVRPDPRRRRRRRRHRAARDADAQLGPPDRRLRQGLRDQEGQRPRRAPRRTSRRRAARAARSSSPTSPTRGAASPRSARRSRSRTG